MTCRRHAGNTSQRAGARAYLLEQVLATMRTELTRRRWPPEVAVADEVPLVAVEDAEPELLVSRVPVTSTSCPACGVSSALEPSSI